MTCFNSENDNYKEECCKVIDNNLSINQLNSKIENLEIHIQGNEEGKRT